MKKLLNLGCAKIPLIFCCCLFLLSCNKEDSSQRVRPNFVFIIIDDQNQDLACFGKDYVKTPNLDKLAAQGVIFPNAYVQQAVCAASKLYKTPWLL